MSNKRLWRILLIVISGLLVLIFLAVCLGRGGRSNVQERHYFSEQDAAREIYFENDRIFTSRDSYVRVSGNKVTITRSGTYMLKGDLEDGQVIVDVGKEAEVKLKLNDFKATCSFGSPIYVKSAKKLRLRLKDGSENELIQVDAAAAGREEANSKTTAAGKEKADSSTTAAGDESLIDEAKGCIYARSDLTIKGGGSLRVETSHRHGIFSSKDLRIKGGDITVDAPRQALHGKKSVLIDDGILTLKAGTDGIHSNGILEINGGKLEIDAGKYGMYAFTRLYVDKAAQVDVVRALSRAGCQGEMEY